MSKHKAVKRKVPGLPPGSLVFTGRQKVEVSDVEIVVFSCDVLSKYPLHEHKYPVPSPGTVTWLNVKGVHDVNLIQEIGSRYHIHPLVMEDILDIGQRPKLDEYDQGIFISFYALQFDAIEVKITKEQIGLFLAPNLLIDFQEDADDLFASIYTRLEVLHSRMRNKGADYLLYALLDLVVDHYFQVLDEVEEAMEALETEILYFNKPITRSKIYELRNEISQMRKLIYPFRDVMTKINRLEDEWIKTDTQIYLRDLYDHVNHAVDIVENYRDMINGINDLNTTEISFKTNRVIQVLTIISTIFMPLTVIVGIYGMNFEFMPELHWKYGYGLIWGVMFFIFVFMLIFFRKKKWI
ncbi:MAG: magnesium/cobalt transporter CorA [Saprospiraceae bacterium]